MKRTVSLLLGVHAHQPIGNFPEVLEEAHELSYGPFLRTMHRYPEFRFAVHFSGWLLDWLMQRFPADMALLKEMVARGQVELFGGGDSEPVLAVIPERDRLGQIGRLSDRLEQALGQRPEGAWLTERVWEATVVPALADAGIRYVTVDDYHFLCTGREPGELKGYYSTEENGRKLDLFPISEALRYRLPFSPASEAVRYIEEMAEEGTDVAAVYFDDIEKFGIWPETYQWVYEKRWLEDFVQGVLASKVIRTAHYRDYHRQAKTRGIVYLPTTSYIEMNEWTLPAGPAGRYAGLVAEARQAGRFDADKAYLRGGIWKNFLSRYPESNWMHKRMLELSQRLAHLPRGVATPEMVECLYAAQANDAYWHGLFGGLYLPHLRRSVYNAIVRLEALLDECAPRPARERVDLDLDGHDEVFLQNGTLQAVLRLDGSASIHELDAYGLRHNFGDTLRRQAEHYFHKIQGQQSSCSHEGAGIASAHDRVSFKHEIRPEDMVLDSAGRTLFRDWMTGADGAERIPHYVLRHETEGGLDFYDAELGLEKSVTLSGGSLSVAYRGQGTGRLRTEINVAMPSCDGPAGRYRYRGGIPGGFGQPFAAAALEELALEDEVLGGKIVLSAEGTPSLTAAPHYTVSQSEAGFEKIMQAVTLVLEWPASRPIRLQLNISVL